MFPGGLQFVGPTLVVGAVGGRIVIDLMLVVGGNEGLTLLTSCLVVECS